MKYDYLKIKDLDSLNIQLLNCSDIQCYTPLLKQIFQINENNYNKIILKSKYTIKKFISKISYNLFKCIVENDTETKELSVFIKYAALFDPVKYGMNKMDNINNNLMILPDITNNNIHSYINDYNNTSYIDGLFTYLTSKLLNSFNFIHGINFYGSFLGHKNDFKYNLYEELESVLESKDFLNNNNILFTVDDSFNLFTDRSLSKKEPIVIENIDCSNIVVDECNFDIIDHNISSENISTLDEYVLNKIDDEFTLNKSVDSDSLSSASSDTTYNDQDENINYDPDDEDDDDDDEDDEDDDDEDEDETPEINMYIKNFPVNIIAMETISDTLDNLMHNEDIDEEVWCSIFLQIIFILITYQDVFNFVHNDLHTSNIMYNETDKEYIYYHYAGVYYKVPTYGRIWKIIDFGRSIYTVNNITYFSNSFSKDGDAYSQYNVEPYFNPDNDIVKPNFSFDLCRLGCSLFDYFFDSIEDVNDSENDEIQNLINEWCLDYKKRNVLYKKNGEERYPDFKLYKMIARDVKDHTPHNQLDKSMFSKFIISSKKIKNKKIINIDEIKIKINDI